MVKKAIILHPNDNVATVLENVDKGTEVRIETFPNNIQSITTVSNIKSLHKIAIKDIPKGTAVIKYGQIIGRATSDIQKGEHVHTKNLKSWFYS